MSDDVGILIFAAIGLWGCFAVFALWGIVDKLRKIADELGVANRLEHRKQNPEVYDCDYD